MSEQIPIFKLIAIETPVAGTEYDMSFLKKCAQVHSKLSKTQNIDKVKDITNYLVYLVEEEEIVALKNSESASYQKLKDTIQPIMTELNCNIIIVLGHTNTCFDYLNSNQIVSPNTLPTLVLLVACFSERILVQLNTKQSSIDNNIFFFGFQNLMHLLHGEILACKSPHLALPFLDCRFEEVANDIAAIEANVSLYNKPYAEKLDLLKCCEARYEHFKKVFYDYLVNRECKKFTTESLLAKFRSLQNPDGSFMRLTTKINSTNQLTMTEEQRRKYIFSRSEGVDCTEETCSSGKTKYNLYKDNIAKFDDRVKYGNALTKKLFEILNGTDRYTPQELVEKDKEMLALLKGVPKTTALKSLNHEALYRNEHTGISQAIPLFFFIFAENYKLTTQEILKNIDVPLDILLKNNYSLVLVILEHLGRTYKNPSLTEAEAYRLIKSIGTKNPNAIKVAFTAQATNVFLFENKKCYLSIIELIFYQFPEAVPNAVWQLVPKLSQKVEKKEWTIAQACKVLELFLAFGKAIDTYTGTTQKISWIKEYEHEITIGWVRTYKPQLEFVILLYIYLHKDSDLPLYSIDNRIADWSLASTSAKQYLKAKMNRMLKVFQATKDFFTSRGASIESYRHTPEEMAELLAEDLIPMETTTAAIEDVKTYFSTVQPNIQKRKNLNTGTKTATIQQLVALYKGIDASKNEGENALRRLREMHGLYRQFLKNHPRANRALPTVKALTEHGDVDSLWVYQLVEAYLKRQKKSKTTTARRPKVAKITNLSALQAQLANISSQLNSHNRGEIKLHHMRLKSFRRQRNELTQRIRNLTPAAPALAAVPNNPENNNGNTTENENNQDGGRRRTRKIRR